MPETIAQAPAAPTPAAPESKGMAGLLDSIRQDSTPKPAAPAAPAAPEAAKPADTTPAKPTPAAKPESEATEADVEKLLKPNAKAWRVYEGVKKSWKSKESELQAKITALESKPVTQAGDPAKLAALEKQLEELRGETKTWKDRAAQADFTKSEDYDKRFRTPYNREKQAALEEVKHLQVKSINRDGEESVRAGTEADFLKALALPPGEQDEFIHAAFGNAAWRVINRINEMQRISRASQEATAEHSEKYESSQQEMEGRTKKEQEAYESFLSQAQDGIKSHPELGKYFTPDESDPESTAILQKGYEQFDDFATNGHKLPPQERAEHVAAYRAMVAGFSSALLRENRLKSKVTELEAELGKYRKADPGAAPLAGGDVAVPEVKGIAGLILPPTE